MSNKDLTFRLFGEDVNASAAMRKLSANADESARNLKKSFGSVPGYVTALVAGVTVGSIAIAANFQTATARLVTDAGESAKNLDMVRDGIMKIGADTGTSSLTIARGMYTIESAGYHGAAGLKVMQAAAEGAKIGGADLTTVSDALTTAMTDYNLPASQAGQVTSKLIETVSLGKTNMEALAGSLHNVLPAAQSAHLGLGQVLGAMATMTSEGISADQASQNLNHAILALQTPTEQQTKEMAAFGLNSTTVAAQLGSKGLTGTLNTLVAAITSRMGPAGLALGKTFAQSQLAAQSAATEFGQLSPAAQQLAQSYERGDLTLKQWTTSVKGLTPVQANLAKEWASSYAESQSFNTSLRSNQGAAQTFNAALSKMVGGQTGLSVALHLTGDHLAAFEANTRKVSAATTEAGGHVMGWHEIQQTFNQQLAEAGVLIQNAGIRIGTALLPPLTAAVRGFTGIIGPLTENRVLFTILLTTLGAVASGFVAIYVASKGIEAVALISKGLAFTFGLVKAAQLGWAGATTVAALAEQDFKNATLEQVAAAKVAAAAQWLWNAAMNAEPIGLVVVAIAGLVAGLVWFFTQTKLGQQIWGGFTKALGAAWTWLWTSVLQPVFKFIGAAFGVLWNVVKAYIGFYVLEFKILAAIVGWVWTNWVRPIFTLIGAIAVWLWKTVLHQVVAGIQLELKGLGVVVGWLYTNVFRPQFQAIAQVAGWLWRNAIQPAVQGMGQVFTWLWNTVIRPVFGFIGAAARVVGSVVGSVFNGVGGAIRGAFDGVASYVEGVFDTIIDSVNSVISGINDVAGAIGKAVGVHVSLGYLPHLASGGTTTTAGYAMVGEAGAEVVRLPAGASVFPHGAAPAELGGGGGITLNVAVHVHGVYAGDKRDLSRAVQSAFVDGIRSGSISKSQIRIALGVGT